MTKQEKAELFIKDVERRGERDDEVEEKPESLDEVFTPAFLIDLDVVERNCSRFLKFYEEKQMALRPHMKTHKTLEIGEMMTGGSKRGIVVSTLAQAEFFASGGFDDIFVACPVIPNRIPRLKRLVERLNLLHVMVDSRVGLQALLDDPLPTKRWSVFVAVDVGFGREGQPFDSEELVHLVQMMLKVDDIIEVKAFYSHCGQSSDARGEEEIRIIASEAVNRMSSAVKMVKERTGWKGDLWGIGSTPTCSKPPPNIHEMTEVHPGNYVFNDFAEILAGSCSFDDVAVRVATSVISHRKEENVLLVDCGACALTLHTCDDVVQGYCHIEDHPELKMKKMTQEIGFVTSLEGEVEFDKYPIGSKLSFIPFNSCATAGMFPFYWVQRGGRIVGRYRPCRGF